MRSFLTNLLNHVTAAPDDVRANWFRTLLAAMEQARKEKRMLLAGWYQTPSGMQLFQLRAEQREQWSADPPLYYVEMLSLPEIKLYNTQYIVELSTMTMNTAFATIEKPEILTERLEIAIHNVVQKEESQKLTFEHQQQVIEPLTDTYTLYDALQKPLSFFSFSIIKSIVDSALFSADLLPSPPSMINQFLQTNNRTTHSTQTT